MTLIKKLSDFSLTPAELVLPALAAARSLITADGECPIPFKRDFAAVVIAVRPRDPSPGIRTWKDFQRHISWEAWLGHEENILKAERDYMENARHKAFTTWRLGKNNGYLLWHERHYCLPEDSVWPGAVWRYCGPRDGSIVVSTSGLLPDQDELVSTVIVHAMEQLGNINSYPDKYKHLYPKEPVDTIGGESFNRPPVFD